jgi:segregation and condensation protein B
LYIYELYSKSKLSYHQETMGLKQEIEVILFWKNEPMSPVRISETLGANASEVKKALMDLVREYELREGGLQIAFRGNGYVLEPKEEFMHLAQSFVPIDLKIGALRTLAIIAIKEPVKQTEIIEVRGSGAYEHIKDLAEAGWVSKEQVGLTYSLQTTPAFKKNFRLSDSGGELKDQLQKIIAEVEAQGIKQKELEEIQNSLLDEASGPFGESDLVIEETVGTG